jgi:protoporphyrinogen oxidase
MPRGPSSADVIILGGGLTGISAAKHLSEGATGGRRWVLFEKEARLGGHARTDQRDGYHFDKTGHWLHLRDPYTKELIAGLLGDQMVRIERKARIFSNGAFQGNLFGLPPDVVKECLVGFIQAWHERQGSPPGPPANFEDYILKTFGPGIARHFMIPYNHKLWGVHPREITAAWCTRFVPVPSMEDVCAGAVGASPPELGYNISFLYPKQGGIETMTRALAGSIDLSHGQVHTGVGLDALDLETRTVTAGGDTIRYSAVVATIPLPELLRRMNGLGSLYVELADRGPLPTGTAREALVRDSAAALAAAGAIASPDDVLFADLHEIQYAYVVFDDNYYPATERIRSFLESHGIYPRGRYGFWTYNAMEDCILAGREVADTIRKKLAHRADPSA